MSPNPEGYDGNLLYFLSNLSDSLYCLVLLFSTSSKSLALQVGPCQGQFSSSLRDWWYSRLSSHQDSSFPLPLLQAHAAQDHFQLLTSPVSFLHLHRLANPSQKLTDQRKTQIQPSIPNRGSSGIRESQNHFGWTRLHRTTII